MDLCTRYLVKHGSKVKLDDWDPADTAGLRSKKDAVERLEQCRKDLYELQYLLYAENKQALLIVLQAMDAGGKDGTIRHVMAGLNPQGCRVTPFKKPVGEEADHHYLWRIQKAVPPKGEIGIFNRSHYEDVLVVRVHNLVPKKVWSKRYQQIVNFEQMLVENNVHIVKFFLHISKDEQKKRFEQRLADPTKHWKASAADFEERKYWDDYTAAFEEALSRCSTPRAPWYVIPANRKWFRNLTVAEIIRDTLKGMKMKFPKPAEDISKLVIE
jgi:PPK2 family polyphosphate:nucleotide phosphotransferase